MKSLTRTIINLVKPNEEIIHIDRQRNAQLLSTFLLTIAFLGLLSGLSQLILIPGFENTFMGIMAGVAVIVVGYILSRRKNYEWGAVVALIIPPLVVFNSLSVNPQDDISVVFLLIGIMIASIFLKDRWFILVVILYSGFILYLPSSRIGDEMDPLSAHFSIIAMITTLVWITKNHRNLLEKDRHLEINSAYDKTLMAWARALEIRDLETVGHSKRVTYLCVKLAEKCGYDKKKLVDIYRGALLHDIGKMAIPDDILLKPGPLSQSEIDVIKKHPLIAQEMLSTILFLNSAIEIPLYHHERWDGTGYPFGLEKQEIPKVARLFAIVDVWDALCSDRPYRKAWKSRDAKKYIEENSGILFDPEIVPIFFNGIVDL